MQLGRFCLDYNYSFSSILLNGVSTPLDYCLLLITFDIACFHLRANSFPCYDKERNPFKSLVPTCLGVDPLNREWYSYL